MAGDQDGQTIVSSDEKLKQETSWEKEKDQSTFDVTSQGCLKNSRIWSVISKNVGSEN